MCEIILGRGSAVPESWGTLSKVATSDSEERMVFNFRVELSIFGVQCWWCGRHKTTQAHNPQTHDPRS
jgi:hypothetical protein